MYLHGANNNAIMKSIILRLFPLIISTIICNTNAQNNLFQCRGIGGGGALFSPSINPNNENEYYLSCDMSQMFHTVNEGTLYDQIHFSQLSAGHLTKIAYTSDNNIRYCLSVNPDDGTMSPRKSMDAGLSWNTMNDPTSNDAFYIAANPNTTNQLIITDYSNLFISQDGGLNFQLKYSTSEGGGLHIAGVFWDGSTIYIGTSVGLIYSTNGGNSFSIHTASGLPAGQTIYSFSGARVNNTVRLYALTAYDNDIWAGIHPNDYWGHPNGIYSLEIGNNNWTNSSGTIDFENEFPIYLDMAQNDINTIYIAGGSNGEGPYCKKSSDGGITWNQVFNFDNNQNIYTGSAGEGGHNNWYWVESFFGLDVANNNASKVLLTDWGYAHISDDGASTWKQKYCSPSDQHDMNTLISITDDYHSIGLENTTVWQVYWSDVNNMWACYSDISGIRSTDGGNAWSFNYTGHNENTSYRVTKNIASSTLYMATASVHDLYQSTRLADAQLDASTNTGTVKYSNDNGQSWQLLHDFSDIVCWVATDPTNANRLYAAVVNSSSNIGGIWYSNNIQNGNASTWAKLPNPPRSEGHPFNIIVLDNGDVLASYSGHRDPGFTASSGVFLYVSSEGIWYDRSDIGMHYWTKDIIVDPNDTNQNTWYACVYSGWGGAANGLGGLYKTTNRGLTWEKIWVSDRVGSCTINPNNPNQLYVTTEIDGLWVTNDLNNSLPTFSLVDNYSFRQPERIFFNPYNTDEFWVTSFGNGMKMASECTNLYPIIVGNVAACSETSQTYTLQPIAGSNYEWIITGSYTIISGCGINDTTCTVLWNNSGDNNITVHQYIP